MDVRIGASTFIESFSFHLKNMKIKFLLLTCFLAAVFGKTIQLNPQEFCRDTCKQNTCEGDGRKNWSSDQMLSCMMACQMRHIGVSEDECLGHCDRNGQSGCRLTVNEETFNLCGPRDIRGSECTGPVSQSDCELGCHSYPQVTSRYETREMHCPNVNPIAELGRLSTIEDCQAACDDRDDCGAIQIRTRSRHPANNCLLYSKECNENRVDGPCTAIKECLYFERVKSEPRLAYTLDTDRDSRYQRCTNAAFLGAGDTGKTMLGCQASCDRDESCIGIFGVFNIDQPHTMREIRDTRDVPTPHF